MEPIIHPHLLGINACHPPDFVIDRPCDPYGTSLILCFRSPAIISTAEGTETAEIGDCIVHTPAFRQYHAAVPGAVEGYRNDWLHVAPHVLEPIMARLKLPFDHLIATAQPEILASFIQRLRSELTQGDAFSEAMILNQLEGMLLSIARARAAATRLHDRMTPSQQRHFGAFRDLRDQLLEDCCSDITVSDLAGTVDLSPERFAVLYRGFFGTTPYADVIDARMVEAKRLLSSTGMTVKEVAAACGWPDLHYFSRLFKKKTGSPPSRYRRLLGYGCQPRGSVL